MRFLISSVSASLALSLSGGLSIAPRDRDTVPDFRHVKSQGVAYRLVDTIGVERRWLG